MNTLGNLIWIIFGGLVSCALWLLLGVLLCITVIGIPLGVQCFKMAELTLAPFGRHVVPGTGAGNTLVNILWIVLVGWWFALGYAALGALYCMSIVGIPFGIQIFKMALLTLMPFGAKIS